MARAIKQEEEMSCPPGMGEGKCKSWKNKGKFKTKMKKFFANIPKLFQRKKVGRGISDRQREAYKQYRIDVKKLRDIRTEEKERGKIPGERTIIPSWSDYWRDWKLTKKGEKEGFPERGGTFDPDPVRGIYSGEETEPFVPEIGWARKTK